MTEKQIKELNELLATMRELVSRFRIRSRKDILDNIPDIGTPYDENLCHAFNRLISLFIQKLEEYNPEDGSYNSAATRELDHICDGYKRIVEDPHVDQDKTLGELPEIRDLEQRMDRFADSFPDLKNCIRSKD